MFCFWQNLFSVCPSCCKHSAAETSCLFPEWLSVSPPVATQLEYTRWWDFEKTSTNLFHVPNDFTTICHRYHRGKLLQHGVTPPPGLQNNWNDTAAVSCVMKRTACSNGHRISKQTRPLCCGRCCRSESGFTCNWSKDVTCSDRNNHRQDRRCPRRAAAGDHLLLKSLTWFYINDEAG